MKKNKTYLVLALFVMGLTGTAHAAGKISHISCPRLDVVDTGQQPDGGHNIFRRYDAYQFSRCFDNGEELYGFRPEIRLYTLGRVVNPLTLDNLAFKISPRYSGEILDKLIRSTEGLQLICVGPEADYGDGRHVSKVGIARYLGHIIQLDLMMKNGTVCTGVMRIHSAGYGISAAEAVLQ